jgi:hypothetical protein
MPGGNPGRPIVSCLFDAPAFRPQHIASTSKRARIPTAINAPTVRSSPKQEFFDVALAGKHAAAGRRETMARFVPRRIGRLLKREKVGVRRRKLSGRLPKLSLASTREHEQRPLMTRDCCLALHIGQTTRRCRFRLAADIAVNGG